MTAEAVLVFLPAITGFLVLFGRAVIVQYLVVIVAFFLLSSLSVGLVGNLESMVSWTFSSTLAGLLIAADVLLLLFFLVEGVRYKNMKVWALALVQLLLYGYLEFNLTPEQHPDILFDGIATFMFLIINIVGGVIVIYAISYMQEEDVSAFKRRLFVTYLLLFMTVMNMLVVANSLLLFFFLFEMTTLASYLLIRFRADEQSTHNALRALWMNQIGGIVILLGSVVAVEAFGTAYINALVSAQGEYLLLAVGLLSMAAFVKGAAMPFDSWLLGAMVAPTPVSAMLHSATMVKIAPFIILKFIAVIAGTPLGMLISFIGAGVFVMASFLALAKTHFKEILGLSTIAMLGLMMSLIAVGNVAAIHVGMLLMGFHALSKALLFLLAGNLERVYHCKDIESMKGLVHRAPVSVALVIFGFMTMILPPFGVLIGKLMALQVIAQSMKAMPWLIVVLISIVVGGVLLTLLYFKIVSALLSKPSDTERPQKEHTPNSMLWPVYLLSGIILLASLSLFNTVSADLRWSVVALAAFFVMVPLFYRYVSTFDRVKPYHCGERATFDSALFYFSMPERIRVFLYGVFILLFIALALVGVVI